MTFRLESEGGRGIIVILSSLLIDLAWIASMIDFICFCASFLSKLICDDNIMIKIGWPFYSCCKMKNEILQKKKKLISNSRPYS